MFIRLCPFLFFGTLPRTAEAGAAAKASVTALKAEWSCPLVIFTGKRLILMKRKIVCMAVAAILASQLTVGAYYTNDLSFPYSRPTAQR